MARRTAIAPGGGALAEITLKSEQITRHLLTLVANDLILTPSLRCPSFSRLGIAGPRMGRRTSWIRSTANLFCRTGATEIVAEAA